MDSQEAEGTQQWRVTTWRLRESNWDKPPGNPVKNGITCCHGKRDGFKDETIFFFQIPGLTRITWMPLHRPLKLSKAVSPAIKLEW